MSDRDQQHDGPGAGPASFATTHWSVVIAAGQESPEQQRALAQLCDQYWYPLYALIRRKGHQAAEAQDLTQSFFAHLLEKETLRVARQSRGKFRSFLLTALDHFVANQWRRARAQKRGGGRKLLSLDFEAGESRYRQEPVSEVTPEKVYQRRWALTLLDNALERLRDEFAQDGKTQLFEQLKQFLGGSTERGAYEQVSQSLAMSEGAVKVTVHRMRKRCRELLRGEIAQTVTSDEEIDEELRDLFQAVQ